MSKTLPHVNLGINPTDSRVVSQEAPRTNALIEEALKFADTPWAYTDEERKAFRKKLLMSHAQLERELAQARETVIEECVKIIDRKGQSLTNEYCHGDAGPEGYTWSNKEAEWQVILLGELIEELRALKSNAP